MPLCACGSACPAPLHLATCPNHHNSRSSKVLRGPCCATQQPSGAALHLASSNRPVSRAEQATSSCLRPTAGVSYQASLNCGAGGGMVRSRLLLSTAASAGLPAEAGQGSGERAALPGNQWLPLTELPARMHPPGESGCAQKQGKALRAGPRWFRSSKPACLMPHSPCRRGREGGIEARRTDKLRRQQLRSSARHMSVWHAWLACHSMLG